VQAARKRFNANDNIAEFIQPGELEALLDELGLTREAGAIRTAATLGETKIAFD